MILNKEKWVAHQIGKIEINGVTYLTSGLVDHQDMETSFLNSHPFSGATGDQSLSDILFNKPFSKIFLYETDMHKIKFFWDLVQIEKPNPKAAQFLKLLGERLPRGLSRSSDSITDEDRKKTAPVSSDHAKYNILKGKK